jgi:photosystem II stability/assembly factor-like uncharacterized protein
VRNLQKASQTRLFLIEDRASPSSRPTYQSLARALGLTWSQGDITPVRVPDPEQYGKFITVDKIRGQIGLPTISIEARLDRELSPFLSLVRKGCAFDVQLHAGVCEDPRDFNGGWEKIYILEDAVATSYETGDLGALDADQEGIVNQTVPLSGSDWYELKRITGAEIGAADVVQKVVGVIICDSRQCGECGVPSDGCEKVFAVTLSHGGSPGLAAKVIFSSDAGSTTDSSAVSTLAANKDPSGIFCSGINLVVLSNEEADIHYAALADVLNGDESWAKVTTGFVALHGPNAAISFGNVFNWLVGDGGYIYFSSDMTSGVDVQSDGGATSEDLVAIAGVDELNLVAVGDNNAVVFTSDGGTTWAGVTGPAPGVDLTAVAMKSALNWIVGTDTGRLFYTRDGGGSWTEKAFSGSGAGHVRDIKFATGAVGYMAHDTATPAGRIFRTVDGGFSWYILPEQQGQSLPSNDQIRALATCSEDPNLVFGGGLADNGTDGIMVKVA